MLLWGWGYSPGRHLSIHFHPKGIHLVCSETAPRCEPKHAKWQRIGRFSWKHAPGLSWHPNLDLSSVLLLCHGLPLLSIRSFVVVPLCSCSLSSPFSFLRSCAFSFFFHVLPPCSLLSLSGIPVWEQSPSLNKFTSPTPSLEVCCINTS